MAGSFQIFLWNWRIHRVHSKKWRKLPSTREKRIENWKVEKHMYCTLWFRFKLFSPPFGVKSIVKTYLSPVFLFSFSWVDFFCLFFDFLGFFSPWGFLLVLSIFRVFYPFWRREENSGLTCMSTFFFKIFHFFRNKVRQSTLKRHILTKIKHKKFKQDFNLHI